MAHQTDDIGLYDMSASSGDEKPSFLYAMLPRMVKLRVRRLSSLRRSVSQYAIGSYDPLDDSRRSSKDISDFATPPPEYQSRLSLSEPVSDNEDIADGPPLRPLSSCSSVAVDNDSGIRWKFANQGLSLLNLAASEDSRKARSRRKSSNTSLSRQLYVHGLTYLLRGLPSDLSIDEKMSVWSAVPPQIQEVAPISSPTTIIRVANGQIQAEDIPENPSVLQRAIAATIVQLFMIFQFLLPYIQYCFAILYRYEREHRMSERVLASGIQTCEGVLNTGVQISNAIYRINDGKVGQALNEFAVWWIRGVTGGIHQGVGDGLVVLGVDKTTLPNVSSRSGKRKL